MLIKFTKKQLEQINKICENTPDYQPLLKPQDVVSFLNIYRKGLDQIEKEKEHFYVLGLDSKNKIKYIDLVSIGTLNYSVVHPRETFRTAILVDCASIIVAHNHPSGETKPSQDDIKLTKRLVEAGKLIGIEVLDHIIISDDGKYTSLKEQNLI